MLHIARYFQATWHEQAPFQKLVCSPSWRRRGRRWSYGMRRWWSNLVPITHKVSGLFQWTFTIIGWIKNKQLHFITLLRKEYNVHPIFYDWWFVGSLSFGHRLALSWWRKVKSYPPLSLLPKYVSIAIYHKYLESMSFWCTWSSLKTLTHLIIACRTQTARCQTIIINLTGQILQSQ